MSGDAGGALFGGLVAIAAAPFVLAAGAAAAAGYGLVKGGIALTKYLAKKAEEKEQKKQISVNNCSAELFLMYENMNNISSQQERQFESFAKRLTEDMNSMGLQLSKMNASGKDAAFIRQEIDKIHKALVDQLVHNSAETRTEILKVSRKTLKECTEKLDDQLAKKHSLEVWSKNTAAHLAIQKSLADEVIRDAKASVQAFKSIADSSNDSGIKSKYIAVEMELRNAEESQKAGMYQLAFADAKNVVMQCAILVSNHMSYEMEIDMLSAEVLMQLETIYGEMEKGRKVCFTNETNNKAVEADLNQFSQGKYAKVMNEIRKEINLVMSAGTLSLYELEELNRRIDEEIIPKAVHIMETARTVMQQYYEREYALTIIAKHMQEQNYQVKWLAPVGGDPSQELVVNFVRQSTGESISVSMTSDAKAGDIANMALSIHSFTNGVEASEEERKEFREELMKALREAGFEGDIKCLGKENQSSDKTEYLSKEAMLKKKTENII